MKKKKGFHLYHYEGEGGKERAFEPLADESEITNVT